MRDWVLVGMVVTSCLLLIAWMSRYQERDRCEDGCHLPAITLHIWGREEYRCRECGTRYVIVVDLDRPREHYRFWVPKKEAARLWSGR